MFPRGIGKISVALSSLIGIACLIAYLHLGLYKKENLHFLTSHGRAFVKEDTGVEVYNSKQSILDTGTSRHAVGMGQKSHALFRNTFNISSDAPFPIGRDNHANEENYFIYRCDEGTLSGCGGWLDRLQGAMAAYMIANLTGRTFKMEILMESCDFHRFIVPNKVDWYLPVSFHTTIKESANISVLRKMDDTKFMDNVDFNFTTMPGMKSKVVYFKGNREYFWRFQSLRKYRAELSWMKNLNYGEIGNALYRRLFKPSVYLRSKLESFLANYLLPHEKLVCAHMRTGRNPTIPQDSTYMRISQTGIRNTINFLQNMTKYNDSRIFFMSDNEGLIRRMKGLSFGTRFFFSTGKIVHVGKTGKVSPKEKCEGLEKIVFEHHVLFHCDVILVSKSAIGLYAAFVRNTDKGLFCLNDEGSVESCNRNKIMDVLGLVAL